MGKREIGKLGVIDLIVSILIAELCAISIENINDSIFLAVLPILVLVGIEVLFAKISLKSRKFRTIVSGRTSLIINQGKINYKEMIKQRYTLDDLLLSLRQEQIKNIEDVEYAFLENNGRLSIFKYNMFKIKGNYPLPIIIDGIIQKDTLKDIKKSSLWLKMYLKKQQLLLEDVFYAFYKGSKIYIIKKSDLIV
ncbi:MAG: YetF domain-containing protein [Bacilli bacterium]